MIDGGFGMRRPVGRRQRAATGRWARLAALVAVLALMLGPSPSSILEATP